MNNLLFQNIWLHEAGGTPASLPRSPLACFFFFSLSPRGGTGGVPPECRDTRASAKTRVLDRERGFEKGSAKLSLDGIYNHSLLVMQTVGSLEKKSLLKKWLVLFFWFYCFTKLKKCALKVPLNTHFPLFLIQKQSQIVNYYYHSASWYISRKQNI